tara:strand:+ start:777 stop:1097 length:321 start_codon:yes stop_codon:yes gene_type:complete
VLDNNTQQEQDRDDGLLFFHTHSIWEAISKLEKFYECKIYGVLDLQEVEENIQLYGDYSSVSKQMLLEAMDYAYNKVDAQEYEIYLDRVREYIDTHQALAEDDAYE